MWYACKCIRGRAVKTKYIETHFVYNYENKNLLSISFTNYVGQGTHRKDFLNLNEH